MKYDEYPGAVREELIMYLTDGNDVKDVALAALRGEVNIDEIIRFVKDNPEFHRYYPSIATWGQS